MKRYSNVRVPSANSRSGMYSSDAPRSQIRVSPVVNRQGLVPVPVRDQSFMFRPNRSVVAGSWEAAGMPNRLATRPTAATKNTVRIGCGPRGGLYIEVAAQA